jgi:hypothetical protein
MDNPDLADGGRYLFEGCGVHLLDRLRRVGLELGQGRLEEMVTRKYWMNLLKLQGNQERLTETSVEIPCFCMVTP